MRLLIDLLDAFNWMDRVEGAVSAFVYADWQGAAKQGAGGIPAELARTVTGANAWTFHIPRSSGWFGSQVESLLNHYAIVVWGRRVTSTHTIISVKERQANWAEYLILRRGIPLDGRLYNPDNQRYAQKYAPGDQPPAWADRGREPPPSFQHPATEQPAMASPVQEQRGVIDRLGDLF